MVLIAAVLITKSGKPLMTRQFVADMPRGRLEGLVDVIPKLICANNERQHTFFETDSIRYVYQPLDNIYVVLMTTKNSNILEDLETLRLFVRVIPEYCRSNGEKELHSKVFDLILAFDEIVTLGYRESVNLAQIKTFTEMDSHEERVHNQIVEEQVKKAKAVMQERQKEIERRRKDEELARRLTRRQRGSLSASPENHGVYSRPLTLTLTMSDHEEEEEEEEEEEKERARTLKLRNKPGGSGKALKLGGGGLSSDRAMMEPSWINELN